MNVPGDDDYEYVLGPTSHDKTVSLAVSPADAKIVAVTGWTSLENNDGPEGVWYTTDAARHGRPACVALAAAPNQRGTAASAQSHCLASGARAGRDQRGRRRDASPGRLLLLITSVL